MSGKQIVPITSEDLGSRVDHFVATDKSEYVHSPMYDIFEQGTEDISTDSLQYLEFRDVNLNSASSVNDYRLECPHREQWFLPHMGFLNIRYNLIKQGGA